MDLALLSMLNQYKKIWKIKLDKFYYLQKVTG